MREKEIVIKLDLPGNGISEIKHQALLKMEEQLVWEEFVSCAKAFCHTQ